MLEIDIGVSFGDDKIDTSFMKSIMQSGIADSGLESNGYVFYEDTMQGEKISENEFNSFLESCGISEKEFREW